MSETVSDTVVVEAPPEAVWDVIADFEAYPQWQEDVEAVEVLETDQDGWGTQVRFRVDARLFTAEFTLAYTYTDDALRWTLVESPQLAKNEGAYVLEPLDEQRTRVTYELELEPTVRVPGMLRRKAARRIVDAALKHMKTRAEGSR